MWRVLLLFVVACDTSGGSKPTSSTSGGTPAPEAKPSLKDKAVKVVNKVDNGLDKLDADEATTHLAAAKESISGGGDAAPDCAWANSVTDATDAIRTQVKELRQLCSVDVPLAKATHAVVAAEKAKAEQPGAPSYTECSSDTWAKAKKQLDGSTEPRWTDLQTRWKKVCPDAP